MIKKMSLKKISICLIALFALFLFSLFPSQEKLEIKEELEYKEEEESSSTIYLLDSNNYLAQTSINLSDKNIKKEALKLLTALIKNEKYENKIPSGFISVIPSNTKILNLNYNEGVIKVDFSSELMDTSEENEEKIIEAIVYTLTSIKDVKYIIIYMEGEILTKLPKSNITLPSTLDRSFGINKEYDLKTKNEITNTTIYYINKYNDEYYYVPVTKVNNDTREKAEIIIEELKYNSTYNSNLMSFLNSTTDIVSINETSDILTIDFTENIYNDKDKMVVLDEVVETISMSLLDNYNIENVVFTVNNQEIYKSS